MSLDYSQKRLLSTAFHKKGSNRHAILFPMRRKKNWKENLETYAFWTGFMSTLISLLQVIIIAFKK
jgi:hypothetical protein